MHENKDIQMLFRASDLSEQYEIESAKSAGFNVVLSRMECKDSLVISRYACLPYYSELVKDLKINNSFLINSLNQHQYIAGFEYYHDIEKFTAKTYFALDHIEQPIRKDQQFVLKGRTNSRKHKWNTCMLSKGWDDTVRIFCELMEDQLIGPQGIIIREYLPLKQLGKSDITGQPYTNEWRFWFLGNRMLTYSYYWSIVPDEVINSAKMDGEGMRFVQNVANIISKKVNFFVLDIAQLENGSWKLIEVNDAQCSGLPFNSDVIMYNNLYQELKTFKPI